VNGRRGEGDGGMVECWNNGMMEKWKRERGDWIFPG
jgi:hypothetical protein